MRLEDLFEKRERVIYQLLCRIQNQPGNAFVKDLCDHLGVSRSTLVRYVESLEQEAQALELGLSLQIQGEQLLYRRAPDLRLTSYARFFAQSSLKYQILSAIFDKEDFSIQALSQKLLISEASLNRQLSALNQLLDEFGIAIRRGRLQGSELQIRYFYYQLFWLLGGAHGDDFAQARAFQGPAVQVFERLYEDRFRPRQVAQLQLWLVICHKRMRLSGLEFSSLEALMAPYQDHKFYERLRQVVMTLLEQVAGGFQEGEVMCLFAFLFFHFILGAPQVEQMLAFGGPIKEATSLGLARLRELLPNRLVLDEEALYHLNQLMGQIYFFQGQVVSHGSSVLAETYRREARLLFQEMSQGVYGQKAELAGDFYETICHELGKLFDYMTMELPSELLIGVALSGDGVDRMPVLHQLRKALEQNRYISIEEWQEGETYDLVISDFQTFAAQPTYLLYHGLSQGDLTALKNMIQQLGRQKSERPLYRRSGNRSRLGFS